MMIGVLIDNGVLVLADDRTCYKLDRDALAVWQCAVLLLCEDVPDVNRAVAKNMAFGLMYGKSALGFT